MPAGGGPPARCDKGPRARRGPREPRGWPRRHPVCSPKAQCMQVARADIASADFGGEEPAQCPEGDAPVVATSEGETMMAREATWDAAKHPRVELGVVVYDAPSVLGFHSQKPQLIERMFEP